MGALGGLTLLEPSGLLLLAGAAPIVVFYILKTRRPRLRVGSTWLWTEAERSLLAKHPFRRLLREASLLLQLVALAALALALARPALRGRAMSGDHIAIVLDTSASMEAIVRAGAAAPESRFARAQKAAHSLVDALAPGSDAFVVEAAGDARIVTTAERDTRRLHQAIDGLVAKDVEGDLAPAIALAADRLRASGGRARLVVVTDGALAHRAPIAAAGVPTEVIAVATEPTEGAAANAAIVRVDVRAGAPRQPHREEAQVFAMVQSFDARARDVFVTATVDGASEPVAARRVLLPANTKTAVVLTFEPRADDRGKGLVVALASGDGSAGDALASDDRAYARVPPTLKMPVTLASTRRSSWLARALEADPAVDLQRLSLDQLATVNVDPDSLVVVEGACPAALPGRDLLVVAPPPGACRGVEVGARTESATATSITSWESGDPRLRFLTLDGVHVREATPLRAEGSGAPLVRASAATLVADASTDGRGATIVGFDVGESDWPLQASFVLFMRNVVEVARLHRTQGAANHGARTGEPLRVAVPADATRVIVTSPGAKEHELDAKDGVVVITDTARAGLVEVRWTAPRIGKTVVPLNLTSEAESDLTAHPLALDAGAGTAPVMTAAALASPREVAPWAMALAALAMAVDLVWLTRARATARGEPSQTARPTLATALAAAAGLAPVVYCALVYVGALHDTYVRFYRPWLLLLAAAAAPLLALRLARLASDARTRMAAPRRRFVTLFAMIAVIASLVALAEPEIGRPLERLTAILALDRSRSIDLVPGGEARTASERRLAEASMRRDDRLGVVVFGAEAATEDPPRPPSDLPPPQRATVGRDGSDLEAAVRRALAELPSDSAGRVVLVSDGVQTRGDALAAAAAAVAANVPVDAVVLEQKASANVRVVAVRSDSHADDGEALDLRVTTHSAKATDVSVRVRLDGEPLHETRAHVELGEDVIRLRETATRPGLHRYDVEVTALDPAADSSPDDNAGSTFVRVRGPSLALVLEGDAGKGAPLVRALKSAGFLAEERSTTGVPGDVGALAGYDLVVLSDVRASDLSTSQVDALASYTRDLGGGLLLMGGDRSMGPGGFARTPLEEVSPVAFDLKEEKRRASLAEVIAIDYSGSMAATVGGQTKLALANEAAARSASLLGPGDRLGVEHVDDRVAWTVATGPVTDPAAIAAKIRHVDVGGGGIYTDIALKEAYAALAREAVNLRHVLLFADGDDAERLGGCRGQVKRALAGGITTSVISLGRGHDTPELEVLSKLGNGRFYLIDDATKIPAVFSQETILATKSAIHEEPFRVTLGAPSPAVRGIDLGDAPALGGYVVTVPKPRASVLLTGPEGDPVLASWAVGLGRAAAFTSDYKDRWGAAWLTWSGGARLFGQLARETARKADDPRIRLASDTRGGALHVIADVVGEDGRAQSFRRLSVHVAGPDGFSRDVPLEATGAGRYSASVPLTRLGTYVATAKDELTGDAVGTTGAVLTTGEELRPTGSDRALLARIATMTGGKLRDTLAGLFDDRAGRRFAYTPAASPLVLLAAFALVLGVGARRVGVPDALTKALDRMRARPAAPRERHGAGGVPRRTDAPTPVTSTSAPSPAPARSPSAAPPVPSTPDAPEGAHGPPAPARTAAEILAQKRRDRR